MKPTGSILALTAILLALGMLVPPVEFPQLNTILPKPLNIASPFSVFVENVHDFTSDEIQLLNSYGTVTTVEGQIAVLHTQKSYLDQIMRLPFVIRIERSHPLTVNLDRSVPDIGAPEVWDEVKDPLGRNVTGKGVIIGFVDTGIDTTHPDFTFPNGSTKILYVWDQTIQGRPPAGFNYGFECNSPDIESRTCPEVDTFGHGTHVAGIAASSGMATGKYVGVAPDASVIFVKAGYGICSGDSWTFGTTELLDGVNYLVKKANQLGMRLVISLSLGGNIGAHDGTDPLELGLDAVVRAGTPVVVAAGNQAQDNAHVRGRLSQGGNVTLQLEVQQTTVDLQIDVWYSSLDRISATLTDPNGTTYPVPTRQGGVTGTFGNVTTLTNSYGNGDEAYLEVNSTASLPAKGWSVTLKADQINAQGWWDAWTDTITCSYPGSFFLPGNGYDIDSSDTVGIPGTARFVVTVGAYISKTSWKGMNGQTYGRKDIAEGGIAPFSSLGPTRDGRIKPDVVAPGYAIASARSSAIPSTDSDPDQFHRILAGTSMATPHVAGTIALMLQYSPHANATEIPAILRGTARLDASTGLITGGSPVWGFGKIDARTATGLYRLTLTTGGLPGALVIPVQVDGSKGAEAVGDTWSYLYFLKGTVHQVVVPAEIQGSQGIRYQIKDANFEVSANSLRMLNYSTQYLLTVNSPYGVVSGQGWYDVNATATAGAPEHVPATGVLGYFGAEYNLAYWVKDNGQASSNPVVMDAPRTLTAVYVLTLPLGRIAIIAVILAVLLVTIVVIMRKRRG